MPKSKKQIKTTTKGNNLETRKNEEYYAGMGKQIRVG